MQSNNDSGAVMTDVGSVVSHRTHKELGHGTIVFIDANAGQRLAYVRWASANNANLPAYPIGDLELYQPIWERVAGAQEGNLRAQERNLRSFVLRLLGRWFESRHFLTGELANQPFAMLPHQVVVANRVIQSDERRWLLADDVGLGKTIEAGMILRVLRERSLSGQFRCLILTPAGLTRQWQDEMAYRFGLNFLLFNNNEPNALGQSPLLIASIDTLRQDRYIRNNGVINQVAPWDLLIVDEAHHLATETSVKRYKLVKKIVDDNKCDAMLFLTATPHSGKPDHFYNMISLLRSDLFKNVADMTTGPMDRINGVMIRNRKSHVQDVHEKYIFKGVTTTFRRCRPSPNEVAFFKLLTRYLREGYNAAQDNAAGSAVGFVMATYRKMASSSPAAIRKALETRVVKLQAQDGSFADPGSVADDLPSEEAAERAVGAKPDSHNRRSIPSPIANELGTLNGLVCALDAMQGNDTKLAELLALVDTFEGAKVIIFTQYVETQAALIAKFNESFGSGSALGIDGSMQHEQRRRNCDKFNDETFPRFLVATEAGGEGLNLQKACHIIVNYDLPWNPIRLQQRIGRVYRYGQTAPVQVFNFRYLPPEEDADAIDAFIDGRIAELLDERISEISRVFAAAHNGGVEDVRTEVIGVLADAINIDELYQDAMKKGRDWLDARVVEKGGIVQQILMDPNKYMSIFRGLRGFNLDDYRKVESKVTPAHLGGFLKEYLAHNSIKAQAADNGLISFTVNKDLTAAVEAELKKDPTRPRHGSDSVTNVTVDKNAAEREKGARLLRFGDLVFDAMVSHVHGPDFTDVASIHVPAGVLGWTKRQQGLCAVFDLRVTRQAVFNTVTVRNDLRIFAVSENMDVHDVTQTLLDRIFDCGFARVTLEPDFRKNAFDAAVAAANQALEKIRADLHLEKSEGIVPVCGHFAVAQIVAA